MGSHRHAYTVGFISMMILGVASRVVPILAGVESERLSRLWGPFILLNVGCAGRVLLQVLTDFFPATAFPTGGLTGFVEVHCARLVGRGVVAYDESGTNAPPQTVGCIASDIDEVRAIAG